MKRFFGPRTDGDACLNYHTILGGQAWGEVNRIKEERFPTRQDDGASQGTGQGLPGFGPHCRFDDGTGG
ncbi:hypothetical protein JCM14720_05700 [Calditerricola yamamurae]